MPLYEEEGRVTREDLQKLRKTNQCKVCGGMLNVFMDFDNHKAFLACNDWLRTHHEGIEREASRYKQEGLGALNIKTRREIMVDEHGEVKTRALDKYMGVVSLTKPEAREIIMAVYPDAPVEEVSRAVMLCASYGLNPLMKHVFLIMFKKWNRDHTQVIGEDWVTVMGIKAKRLLSSRRGSYSYVDNTPRVMTEKEQMATFGEVDNDKLWVITKVKDPQTSAEAVGYGFWPKADTPKGMDKGNTKFNMAAIRSESQALDRLRPGEMPEGIEVMPEEAAGVVIEGEFKEVDEKPVPPPAIDTQNPPDHLKEHWCVEHGCPFEKKTRGGSVWYAHKLDDGSWCNENKKKAAAPTQPAATAETETEQEAKDENPERDPDTIKTINDLYKACNENFKLQPAQVLKELGFSSQSEISDTPAECYRKIAAVR